MPVILFKTETDPARAAFVFVVPPSISRSARTNRSGKRFPFRRREIAMRSSIYIAIAAFAAVGLDLSAHAAPSGSYEDSCQNIQDTGRAEMSAECMDRDGRYRFSSLRYDGCAGDIVNDDGQLVCGNARAGNGYNRDGNDYNNDGRRYSDLRGTRGLPAGSWIQSCRDADMRGSVVQAECQGD
jgi:hypothetical protein